MKKRSWWIFFSILAIIHAPILLVFTEAVDAKQLEPMIVRFAFISLVMVLVHIYFDRKGWKE